MPRFSLITFDCYGTLIDWESGMKNALRNLTKRRNISFDIESLPERYIEIELEIEKEGYRKYKEVLGLGVRRLFEEKGIMLSSEEEKIFADSINTWPPFNETTEVLRKIKEKYKLAILSNIDEDLIKHSIKLIGVEFDGVITAEQVKSYKPSHGHWKRMMDVFKIPKENVLHVAASYVHDIVPAKELGFQAVWINRKDEKLKGSIKPDYEFRDLRPLVNFLEK
ncbi:MAG: haloacid dehalogenase, 2-haloacid dehalogenase [Candidatus Dadabacteria bacterium CSP1-2]|nr:MAG: haloacid dehalogenase, 2-haloacid dehalogenase [Candidatus Dadabacteria bacterium CSP1-2]